MKNSIVSFDNENFINASEFSSIVGMKYSMDSDNQSITINYKDISKEHKILTAYEYDPSIFVGHNNPEFINNVLYFPFKFLENNYQIVIKYSQSNSLAYIFPSGVIDNTKLKAFSNISYNYSFPIPDKTEISFNENNNGFTDSSILLKDKSEDFSAVITCDRLDSKSMIQMRQYLKNYTLTDDELFEKFAEYKHGYFDAMQNYYKKDFLYGKDDELANESNMKIFAQYTEKVYTRDTNIVLYNIINSNKLGSNEETHINISIPVKMDNSVFSIYSVDFTVNKGGLNDTTLKKMSDFFNSIRINKLIKQTQPLFIFRDANAIKAANLGIYPDLTKINLEYSTFSNSSLGYQITYPSIFIPYRQNNIITTYDYESYKIDYNNYFSICAEPYNYDNNADYSENLNNIPNNDKGNISSVQDSVYKTDDGKEFRHLSYEISVNSSKTYIQEYFIPHEDEKYEIRLVSRFNPPSQVILEEFLKTVISLKFSDRSYDNFSFSQPIEKFINLEEGYSFYFPDNWTVSQKKTQDINNDIFELKNLYISGSIEVSVSEGELANGINAADVLPPSNESYDNGQSRYFSVYNSPINNRTTWLLCSSCYQNSNTKYIVKLINYMDENGRNKCAYVVDAIRGRKVYSLFISASDYTTLNGKVSDKSLNALINLISSTFILENTQEYIDRQATYETRNRKIVFIENYFQLLFGTEKAHVESANYIDPSGLIQVKLTGVPLNGFYNLKLDYEHQKINIEKYIKIDEGE